MPNEGKGVPVEAYSSCTAPARLRLPALSPHTPTKRVQRLWAAAAVLALATALLWAFRPTLSDEIRPDRIRVFADHAYESAPLFRWSRRLYLIPSQRRTWGR